MKTKELQEKIVSNMERWKKIEDRAVASTGQIIVKTGNPIVRLIMEIIQRDSQMHYRVEDLISDSLQGKAFALTPEELGQVWAMVEAHIELEKETVRIAKESLESLKGKKMVVQEYLLEYLLQDEMKHEAILQRLATIKQGMYPYG